MHRPRPPHYTIMLLLREILSLVDVISAFGSSMASNEESVSDGKFNIVVFYTNQVQSDPGAMFQGADGRKAIGGHVLAHASTTRILLRKGRGDERVANLRAALFFNDRASF